MLSFEPHRRFKKNFNNLPKKVRQLAADKIDLFLNDSFHSSLRAHKLHGIQKDLYAFSINQKYRILFGFQDPETVIFYDIGTHSVYKK